MLNRDKRAFNTDSGFLLSYSAQLNWHWFVTYTACAVIHTNDGFSSIAPQEKYFIDKISKLIAIDATTPKIIVWNFVVLNPWEMSEDM